MQQILARESPQTVALFLGCLPPKTAAIILKSLSHPFQVEVLMRQAKLDAVAKESSDLVLEQILMTFSKMAGTSQKGGVAFLSSLINSLNQEEGEGLLQQMKARDVELGSAVEKERVVFADIVQLDSRSIQAIIAKCARETLLTALRGASSDIMAAFTKNMSERAASQLQEDLTAQKPVPKKEVEMARQKILEVIRTERLG